MAITKASTSATRKAARQSGTSRVQQRQVSHAVLADSFGQWLAAVAAASQSGCSGWMNLEVSGWRARS